jgi:hypothetical protein
LLTITASGALLFTLFGIRRKAPATSYFDPKKSRRVDG